MTESRVGELTACDPFGPWASPHCARWLLFSVVVAAVFGPGFVLGLQPGQGEILDFYQEWSSARCVLDGLPAYMPVEESVVKLLGMNVAPGTELAWNINAHPPTSILIAIPFALLDYPAGTLAWNVVSLALLAFSLWLVVRGLGIRFSPWALLPVLAILLASDPFRQQMRQGQLNLVLLSLLTGAWVCDRSDRPRWAGVLVGVATCIKIFPGFLFVYFLLRRDVRATIAGTITVVLLTAATVGILGTSAFETYGTEVLPGMGQWKAAWNNASITGFWSKFFAPGARNGTMVALVDNRLIAQLGAAASSLVVLALFARRAWQARTLRERDLTFALSVTTMLLVAPATWEHYFLLLIPSLAIVWIRMPCTSANRWLLGCVLAGLCFPMIVLANLFVPGGFHGGTAGPLHTVTVLSIPFYALLGLFVLCWRSLGANEIAPIPHAA
jgi:hypothetical protein